MNNNVTDTKVENFYSFSDRILKFAYDTLLDNHHSNHENSILTIVSNFNKNGVEKSHIN